MGINLTHRSSLLILHQWECKIIHSEILTVNLNIIHNIIHRTIFHSQISKEEWKPDFGPSEFRPRWGATIAGARKFLIAYNINLLSTKEQAHRIALNIREQGRSAKEPGRLKGVQGLGWWFDEGKIAQVSTNLTDLDVTSLHQVWEEVNKDATELQLPIIGSEIVGLVPLRPMLDVAEYFIKKENLFVLEEEQKVQLVRVTYSTSFLAFRSIITNHLLNLLYRL